MPLLSSVLLATVVLLTCRRFGSQRVLPFALLTTLGVSLTAGTTVGVAVVIGLVAGMLLERGFAYGVAIFGGALPAVLQSVAMVFFAQELIPEEELGQLVTQLESMGLQMEDQGYSIHEIATVALRLQPGMECVMGILSLVLAYRFGQSLAPRFGLDLPTATAFRLWRPWDELIWVLIVSLVLVLVGGGILLDLGLNALVVVAAIYATHGAAVVRFYMARLGVPPLVEVFVYLSLVFTMGISIPILGAVGILDTWFDWRHLRTPQPQPESDADGTSTL